MLIHPPVSNQHLLRKRVAVKAGDEKKSGGVPSIHCGQGQLPPQIWPLWYNLGFGLLQGWSHVKACLACKKQGILLPTFLIGSSQGGLGQGKPLGQRHRLVVQQVPHAVAAVHDEEVEERGGGETGQRQPRLARGREPRQPLSKPGSSRGSVFVPIAPAVCAFGTGWNPITQSSPPWLLILCFCFHGEWRLAHPPARIFRANFF